MINERRGLGARISHALPSVNFLGASCWVAWVLVVYTGDFLFFDDVPQALQSLNTQAYLLSTLSLSITMIFIGIFHVRCYGKIQSKAWMFSCAALVSVACVVMMLVENGLAPLPLFYVANIATGFGTGWIAQRCAVQFSELRPHDAFIMSAFVQILAFLIYALIIGMTSFWVRSVLFLLLPLVAAAFTFCHYSVDESALSDGEETFPEGFGRFVVGVFLLIAAFSIVRGYFPNDIQVETFARSRELTSVMSLIACVIIIVLAGTCKGETGLGRISYWITVGVTFSFVIAPILGLNSFYLGSMLGSVNALLCLVVWAMLACVAYRSGTSALRITGIGFSAVSVGSTLGWAIGFFFVGTFDQLTMNIMNAVLVAVVLVVMLFLFNQDGFKMMAAVPSEASETDRPDGEVVPLQDKDSFAKLPPTPEPERIPRWRLHVMDLAERYGLSERETEVFFLLAKGKSAQTIADELCVSYNTARTHVRNIYAKCEVHSRHEFESMIEQGRHIDGV